MTQTLHISSSTRSPAAVLPRRCVHASAGPRGFTIMELMVSITILVAVILAINISFSGATKAVTSSQATMDLMANVRATEQLVERDVRGMDRNSFLVIRGRLNDTSVPATSLHFDQVSFVSMGQFQNPTGCNNSTSPFTDSSTASAAHVWWGQLIMEKGDRLIPATTPPSYRVPDQSARTVQDQLPTGAWDDSSGNRHIVENEFVLGRHLTLLFPGPPTSEKISPTGNPVMAYPTIALGTPAITGSEGLADISSSRYAVVGRTSAEIMRDIVNSRAGGTPLPEADFCTYRFRALQTVYDTEVTTNPFVNGTYRMTPVVMGGVSSFKVEWTDGAIYGDPADTSIPDPHNPSGLLTGQVKWYGPTLPSWGAQILDNKGLGRNFGTNNSLPDPNIEQVFAAGRPGFGDHYIATFSYFNKNRWPKALRFTYHIYGDRLGGRDVVQVVNLP